MGIFGGPLETSWGHSSGEVELLGRRTDARMERLEASIHAIATHLGASGTVEPLTPRLPALPSIEDGKK